VYPPWQVIWEDRRGKTGVIYVAGQKVILFGQPGPDFLAKTLLWEP